MSGPDVRALLSALEAAGVGVSLNAAGDGLTLSGKGRPPADLLARVRAAKPALLAALRPAKEEAPTSSPSPDLAPWADPAPGVSPSERRPTPPRPDWAALAQEAGRCGSCARWEEAPDWGARMGTCRTPPGAWPGVLPPLAIHAGHRCAAYREEGQDVGRGYRARGTGRRSGPRPSAPLPLEALGVAP